MKKKMTFDEFEEGLRRTEIFLHAKRLADDTVRGIVTPQEEFDRHKETMDYISNKENVLKLYFDYLESPDL